MSAQPRVQLWSNVKMVTCQAVPIVHEGEPRLLTGVPDNINHPVCVVKLDDGRAVIVAREHLQVLP